MASDCRARAESIICLLAILKAGGIYLPLDPAYPAERLDYMAADAGALLVLDAAVLQAWNADNTEQEVPLPPLDDAHRVAYIIYTSGTTGKPKGVAVPHSAAVNLAYGRRACHDPLGSGDRVLAAISVGFDVSIGQLLLPLLSGATVVIAPELKQMGARDFWTLLGERQVTHINSVPSFIESILDAAPPPEKLSLKRLMLGGEALQGALVARIRRTLPQLEVVNMYGPTETCIDATFHIATAQDEGATVLPIGRPLPNYRVYVLNEWMEPVGIGVSGELYIGGSGLASGYVNAPELTAERFVADPFSSQPGARLYRTGDRARWRSDQRLEFLGRVDQQIKIRGFRVEPAEIEAVLLGHPQVAHAVVVARKGSQGRPMRLIAYFVPSPDFDSSIAGLRVYLADRLPEYMVPSGFVSVNSIPLTPNGKLDVRALPSDDGYRMERIYEEPRDAAEVALQRIWQKVLGVARIGRSDDFFEMGGDSLSALRMVNAVNAEFTASLPMRSLFEHPTIARLAEMLRFHGGARISSPLVPLQTAGCKRPLFCIHAAGGHVFAYLPLTRKLAADQPVFGLQARGLEAGEIPATSIEEMASDYLAAIKRVQTEGPYQLLGMSSGGLIAYEMAQQIRKTGGEVSFLALLDTTVPNAASSLSEQGLMRALAGEIGCADLVGKLESTLTLPQLLQLAHSAGRLPSDFSLSQAERVAAVFRNIVRLYPTYQPEQWDGSMLLLRALHRSAEGDLAPDWSPLAVGSLKVFDLDCKHEDLVSAALAAEVAALVSQSLDEPEEFHHERGAHE